MEPARDTETQMDKTASKQQRLLIVDDSKVVRITARKILGDHFETVEALDGENAWDILTSEAPFSLVISDLSMPNLDGFGLLERIRNTHLPHISNLPVIIITGANDSEVIKERATTAGATDFIGKPFDSVHLLARAQAHASAHSNAQELKEEAIALEETSAIDPLTKIANERTFMERGYQLLAYAVRHNTRLSVFHIEVDKFGELYKTHGERVSGSIVQTVAATLTTAIRHEDTAARLGTARFSLLLPGLNNNGIHNLADRIRKDISKRVLKHGDARIQFTVSIGVAAMEIRRNTRFDDLLTAANNRLVYAIAHGGDQSVYDDADHTTPSTQPAGEMGTAEQPEIIDKTDIQIEAVDIDQQVIPAVPEQDTPAPLYVPDLSQAPEPEADIPEPEEHEDGETIIVTAASNPSLQPKPNWKTPGVADGQESDENSDATEDHAPASQLADISTLRPGMLSRLWSFFRKPSTPE
jgi:diguanylate cyclase (GGDEF)-like protein